MKKKTFLLIILVTSIFIYTPTVFATGMYMECDYTSECTNDGKEDKTGNDTFGDWVKTVVFTPLFTAGEKFTTRYCWYNYHIFAKLTNSDGSVNTYVFYENEEGEIAQYREISSDCWLSGFTNKNCSSDGVNLMETSDINKKNILGAKICPSGVVNEKATNPSLIPVGQDGTVLPSTFEEITKPVFAIYSFEYDGTTKLVAEGYDTDGKYSIVGPDITRLIEDDIEYYQYQKIIEKRGDYWKINQYGNKLISSNDADRRLDGYNVCKGLTKSECVSTYKYKIIYDSQDSNGNIKNKLLEWYEKQKENIKGLKGITNLSKNSNLITTSKELNKTKDKNEEYDLTLMSAGELIQEISDAYSDLEAAYEEAEITDYCTNTTTSALSSATSYLYKEMDICEIKDIAAEDDDEHNVNGAVLVTSLMEKIKDVLNEISNGETEDLLDASTKATEYVESFYKTILYLERDYEEFGLTSSQLEKLKEIKEKYKNLIKDQNLNISPVVTCKDLFGEELLAKINSYLNIIKIAVPILLIIFGIIDFLKAIFSDEDAMKKAQKTFIKRLGVAILIFLIPIFVKLLLSAANEVWPIISKDTCEIFE